MFLKNASRIEKLPQSGSDRVYFRIFDNDKTAIATYNINVQENDTFIAFTTHFKSKGLPVPEIYAIDDSHTIYLQEDLGKISLIDELESKGKCPEVYELYKKVCKLWLSFKYWVMPVWTIIYV